MRKYAVLIGNGEFPNEPDKTLLPDLNCPKNDIKGLANLLLNEKIGDYAPENVKVLLNKPHNEIIATIEDVFHNATRDDLILIYYSGHGIPVGDTHKLFLSAHNTVYKKPVATAVSMAQLRDLMDIKVSHKKIILILDCCYSGDAGKQFASKGSMDSELAKQLQENAKGIYLLAAAGSHRAWERQQYSLFTQYLIEGLETGNADLDGDGLIDVHELFNYIRPQVEQEEPKQKPHLYGIAETGGKLTFAQSVRDSRKDRAEKIRQLLLDFEKQHEDIAEIKTEALTIAKTERLKLSPVQLQKDQLLTDLLTEQMTLLAFVRAWDRLVTDHSEPSTTASPQKDWQSSTHDKPPKRKISLAVSSIVVLVSLMAGWKFIPFDDKPITTPKLPEKAQAANESPATPTPKSAALKDEIITVKGVDFEMLAIKGGTFQMGSPETEPERSSDEKLHEITVADFQMGKYEVTQKQWQTIMDTNPSDFKGDDLPVENVSWNDIQTFISRLNQLTEKTGHKFRLPTEAQWEYAARAGTNTPFYPYDGKGDCITTTYANFDSDYDYNGCGANTKNLEKKTVAVNSYQPNAFGLYNMAGNVWEWTCSVYVEQYDGSEKQCASSNDAKTQRVIRGGSWSDRPNFLRSANRYNITPVNRSSTLGFRLSRM